MKSTRTPNQHGILVEGRRQRSSGSLAGNFYVQNSISNSMLSPDRIRNVTVLGFLCQQLHTCKTSGKVRQIPISFLA